MHRPNSNEQMSNGLPSQWGGAQPFNTPQKNVNVLNNGVESSRDASPVSRFSNVPVSQLAPNIRSHIPASQLPPGRSRGLSSPINQVTSVSSASTSSQVSPIPTQSTPRVLSTFTTSTPNLREVSDDNSTVPIPVNSSASRQNLSPPALQATHHLNPSQLTQSQGQSSAVSSQTSSATDTDNPLRSAAHNSSNQFTSIVAPSTTQITTFSHLPTMFTNHPNSGDFNSMLVSQGQPSPVGSDTSKSSRNRNQGMMTPPIQTGDTETKTMAGLVHDNKYRPPISQTLLNHQPPISKATDDSETKKSIESNFSRNARPQNTGFPDHHFRPPITIPQTVQKSTTLISQPISTEVKSSVRSNVGSDDISSRSFQPINNSGFSHMQSTSQAFNNMSLTSAVSFLPQPAPLMTTPIQAESYRPNVHNSPPTVANLPQPTTAAAGGSGIPNQSQTPYNHYKSPVSQLFTNVPPNSGVSKTPISTNPPQPSGYPSVTQTFGNIPPISIATNLPLASPAGSADSGSRNVAQQLNNRQTVVNATYNNPTATQSLNHLPPNSGLPKSMIGQPPPNTMQMKPTILNQAQIPPTSQYNFSSATNPPKQTIPPQMNQANIYSNQPNIQNVRPLYPTGGGPQQPQNQFQSNLHSNRYPQPQNTQQQQPYQNPAASQVYNQQQYKQPTNYPQLNYNQKNYQQNLSQQQQMGNMNIVNAGYNKMWGAENYDLLQCPNILPGEQVVVPKVHLGQEFLDNANCSPEIFRCTMTKIPESNSLLQKSRLPLGVLIHPFKDLNHLPVIQCTTIVRCRACRTYINPFIFFVDTKRWKCNLCYRVNELPEEFHYDPVSKSYGDPSRRPEIKSSTIEYIAPSEYMLRPPQPAVYLFLLDISRLAIESGYLHTICGELSQQLTTLPGDARTQIGFIAYNTTLHFFSLAEGLSQPHEMLVSEIDDVFLPCPDNLLVNLKEHIELVTDLLSQLPTRYQNSYDNGSALGAALQAAFKMMSSTGGRVTVFQTSLPTIGPGALTVREDPNQRAGKEAPHLNPATDFYKRLALDCSAHQVAVDLFILNSQYVDVASLSGISRFSGGCMYHFPLFKSSRIAQAESLEKCFRRYLTRKIGFEAVMRIRCTRGLAIHTFHGNFFVRSTDLLSLPNVNPDAGFGMQVSIEESLSDLQTVCFQAALLYTSSKGERRIRVHTLCLPITSTLSDVLNSADQQCIVGFLAKMAVDRSLQTSLSDARDAFINAAIDILSSYKLSLNMASSSSGLLAPNSLRLLPLYILALLKFSAFRTGQSTRLDDRVFAMCDMKTLPLVQLLQQVYPDLYPIHRMAEFDNMVDNEGVSVPLLPRLQLSSRNIDAHGAYLLDAGQQMIIFVGQNVTPMFLTHTLGVPSFNSIPDQCYELPKIDHLENQRLHAFMNHLNDEKPYPATLHMMRENSPNRTLMLEHLIEDRIESALSYNEFLQHLKTQVKS